MFGMSPGSLLVILVIVLLIFGGKRLRGLGGDLGTAIKGFKKAINEDDKKEDPKTLEKTLEKTQADDSAAKKTDSSDKS